MRATAVRSLFPPLDERLGVEVRMPSPRYLEKVSAATIAGSFSKAAKLLQVMSGIEVSAKTVQRQSEAMGERMRQQEDARTRSYQEGVLVPLPENAPELLVITMDGGRVQTRPGACDGGWKENKVGVVYTAVPVPEKAGEKYHGPPPVERTCIATMRNWDDMADMLSYEAECRGLRRAKEAVVIGDGAAGVKGTWQTAFGTLPFILDWAHAVEHLSACAQAAFRKKSAQETWFQQQKEALWQGRVNEVQQEIARRSKQAGAPPPNAPETDARLILHRNKNYFRENAAYMDYARYRKKGWPIGSGIVESTVKQFGKRVKGTEKFWSLSGVESTLALVSYMLSEDNRWDRFWNHDLFQLPTAA